MMKTFQALAIASSILYVAAFATPSIEDIERCDSYVAESETSKNLHPKDCEFSKEGDDHFIRCVVPVSVEAPPDCSEDDDSTTTGEENVTVRVDFGYKIGMFQTDGAEEREGVVAVCLKILAISYKRVLGDEGGGRLNIQLPSSVFNVLVNAEMMSSKVELVEPIFVGKANIDKRCFSATKREPSSCIMDLGIKVTELIGGSDTNMIGGNARFSVNTFGYSYNQYMKLGEDMQVIATFPDRTKRGKVLLKNLPGDNVTELRLPKNKWKRLDDSDMPSLPKLEVLDLSKNSFESFETNVLKDSNLLKDLNFSESHLKETPSFIQLLPNLKVLNLAGNPLTENSDDVSLALIPAGSNMNLMEVLNISGIRTRYFMNTTLPPLPQLRELDASLCKIIDMEEGVFVNIPRLVKINLSKNLLNHLPSNVFAELKYLEYVDLSSNKFTRGQGLIFYPNDMWPKAGMQLLDMSLNMLADAKDLIGYGSKVKHINMASNVLKSLDGMGLNSYGYGAMVEELDISSNLISSLSHSDCDALSYMKKVNLTDNQYDCNSCDLLTFQHWLSYTGRKVLTFDPKELLCTAPPAARKAKIRVIDATYNEEICGKPDYGNLFKSVLYGLALTALICGVLYFYRFEVSYWRITQRKATKKERRSNKEPIYDAFISYSSLDKTWVSDVLQPELEESEQKYQLCFHDRNFTNGNNVPEKIIDSIEKSRKIILILTESFVESQWCFWETVIGNHNLLRRDLLVLIELEQLNREQLPRNLRLIMNIKTCIKWPSFYSDSFSNIHGHPEMEAEIDISESEIEISEQEMAEFWMRLKEALGDSLYMKKQEATRMAEREGEGGDNGEGIGKHG